MPSAKVLALLLASVAAARAQEPAAPPEVPTTTTVPSSPAAPPVPTKRGFALQAGWGYYEALHLGASYHFDERAALALFGGYGVAEAQTVTVGLSFAHALFGPRWTLQPGWNVKAIYWTRSDANYDWTNVSFVLGAYVAKDLGERLRLALDGGVALTAALDSDRKQNFTFGHPERWNGSVCLEISYRLGGP